MADAGPLSGSIDPKAFPFLIGHLHRQGATGSLKVDGPSYQKAVYFRAGRILFGSSNDPKDQLGAILIESGRITPEQLEDVNAKVGPGNPLAKVLSESGFVSQRELGEAARTKVERILSDVLGYTAGSFEFEDGVLPKGAVDLKLSTEKVIVAAVRRVADRSFVLRHIDGLETVFAPTADSGAVLGEIEADTGPFPGKLDGRRTIKAAAAEAAADEFDASKITCALLFLGLVERTSGEEALEATATDIPLFSEADLASELNLGEMAEGGAPLIMAEAEPQTEPPVPPPPAAAAPKEPEPQTIILPAPSEMPETTYMGRSEGSEDLIPESEPQEEPPASAAPPSKEDLAALDALLNARNVEGPLEPLSKPTPESRWEPQFAQGSQPRPKGRGARRRDRNPLLLAGAAAVLAIAGGAGYLFLLRPAATPGLAAAPTTAATATATTLGAASPALEASPSPESIAATGPATTLASLPATTVAQPPPTAGPPTTLRAAGTMPAQPATTRAGPAGSLADVRAAFRKGDLAGSAPGFAANLKAAGRGVHTVQILVACADETVQKAIQNVSAPEMFILPAVYQGKSCYRVCWGIYDSEGQAKAAASTVPGYFTSNGARPKAIPAATVLP